MPSRETSGASSAHNPTAEASPISATTAMAVSASTPSAVLPRLTGFMLGSPRADPGPVPGARSQGRPLRELLHQGLPARRRSGSVDTAHGPQAPPGRADGVAVVHAVRRGGAGAGGGQG